MCGSGQAARQSLQSMVAWPAIAAATASILTGAAVVVTRYAVLQVDPVPLALFRYGLAVLCLAIALLWVTRVRMPAKDRLAVMALGTLFFGLFTLCFNVGLQTVPAARAGIIVAVMPALTLALAAGLGIERLTWTKAVGVGLAVVGVAFALCNGEVFSLADEAITRGDIWLLGAAVCGAVYNVGSRSYLAHHSSIVIAFWSMLGGVCLLGVISAGGGQWVSPVTLGTGALWSIVFLGTASGAFAFTLWIWALANSTPTRVAVFFSLNPYFFTALVTAVLLHFSASLAVGLVPLVSFVPVGL